VIVTEGNRLLQHTSAPSLIGDPETRQTEFHYVSQNGRWHVRQGNGGTMILTDRFNAHPQSNAAIQGKFIVKGKIPEVVEKIEQITADEKKPTDGKLSPHAENLLEHLKDYKLNDGKYAIVTPADESKRHGREILKAAHSLVDAGHAEWVGEPKGGGEYVSRLLRAKRA
jgi:hypothetical protein